MLSFFPADMPDGRRVFFQCQRCTACCRWPGDVKVSEAEIDRIAAWLKMEPRDFVATYTRLRRDRLGLSLTDRADGACIFLDGNDCAIHEVKPQQCRDFPNKVNFPGWRQVCQAIPIEIADETDLPCD